MAHKMSGFNYERRLIANVKFTTRFTGDKVDLNDLIDIVDMARWAPSIGNIQPWEIILIHDPIEIKKLSTLHPRGRVLERASAIYVIVTDPEASKYHLIDGGSILTYLTLAASIKGFSIYILLLEDDYVFKVELNIPPNRYLLGLVAVGKGVEGYTQVPLKKAVRDILYLNKHGFKGGLLG